MILSLITNAFNYSHFRYIRTRSSLDKPDFVQMFLSSLFQVIMCCVLRSNYPITIICNHLQSYFKRVYIYLDKRLHPVASGLASFNSSSSLSLGSR